MRYLLITALLLLIAVCSVTADDAVWKVTTVHGMYQFGIEPDGRQLTFFEQPRNSSGWYWVENNGSPPWVLATGGFGPNGWRDGSRTFAMTDLAYGAPLNTVKLVFDYYAPEGQANWGYTTINFFITDGLGRYGILAPTSQGLGNFTTTTRNGDWVTMNIDLTSSSIPDTASLALYEHNGITGEFVYPYTSVEWGDIKNYKLAGFYDYQRSPATGWKNWGASFKDISTAWKAFVIRNSSTTSTPPTIRDRVYNGVLAKEFIISESGMKAAWGTKALDGKKVKDIAGYINRLDDTSRFTPGSGPAVAPYINIWITDETHTKFAVIANEPSNPEWTSNPGSSRNFDWDMLKTKTAKIYENADKSWLPNDGVGDFTFADFADYTILSPTPSQLATGWPGLGTGAPRELGTNNAYGFNWVFGDTLSNYVSGNDGYIVTDPAVKKDGETPNKYGIALIWGDTVGNTTYTTQRRIIRNVRLTVNGTEYTALFEADQSAPNLLSLDVTPDSIYVKPNETVTVKLNQSNLTTAMAGYQAFIAYDSGKLNTPTVNFTGTPYGELSYANVPEAGKVDVADGVYGKDPVAEDGTLATITFTPTGVEGTTCVSFRENDPPTRFTPADGSGDPIIPTTLDSTLIYIDGTKPTNVTIAADPASWTNSNTVTLTFSASDTLSGIDHYELSLNGGTFITATSPYVWDVSSLTTGVYTATVKAVDKAGNEATASTSVYIDRTAPSLDIVSAKQGTPGAPFNAPGFTYTKVLSGGTHVLASAAFSPDGKKIVFIDRSPDGTRAIKLYDRGSGTIETLMSYTQGETITIYDPDSEQDIECTFWGFAPPYFSADGTKIGWATGFEDAAGVAEVYDVASKTITHYYPSTQNADFYNTDFFGSYTDQWVGWDYGAGGDVADIFLYTLTQGGFWEESANLTSTSDYKEYEPDSNAAGTKILYWSGETSGEPRDTTHLLVKSGTNWIKDTGFTPISGSTWPYWSRDEIEVGVTKYDDTPGSGKGDLYVYDSAGSTLKFDLTGLGVEQGSCWQYFGFNFAVGPAGEGREYLFTSGAANTQGGRDIWIAKISSDPELIYSYRTGTPSATQGKVYITVTAGDANSGLAGPPVVTVKDSANIDMPATYIGESPVGTFIYSVNVLASTANGMATVTVEVADKAGNTKVDTDYFDINKSTAAVTIKLQGVNTPTTRWIKFTLGGTGGTVAPVTFEKQVGFDSTGTAVVTLECIPTTANWTRISAKDEQHTLRQTVDLVNNGNQQYSASFTGTDALLGGDATNDNLIDILDFGVFAGQYGTTPSLNTKWPTKNADFDCSGAVGTTDFTFISTQFLARGDALPGNATADASVPRKSITVNELAKIIGVVSAKKADLNYDGVVDEKDMALFAKQIAK